MVYGGGGGWINCRFKNGEVQFGLCSYASLHAAQQKKILDTLRLLPPLEQAEYLQEVSRDKAGFWV